MIPARRLSWVKGQRVWTGGGDEAALSKGVFNTYIEDNLRYSQNAPLNMYKEVNTGSNLPAQIDLYAVDGDEYKFLCVAKGGGSANKTYLYQETKALLTPCKLKTSSLRKCARWAPRPVRHTISPLSLAAPRRKAR